MLAEPKKTYIMKIQDIRNVTPGVAMTTQASSVSGAVEEFLKDYLKNNRLHVSIIEVDPGSRRI